MKKTVLFLIALVLCFPVMTFAADGQPFQNLQRQIDQLNTQLQNIQLTPGPQGPEGPTGPAGPEGPRGPSDAYATYLQYGSVPFDELPRIGDSHIPGGLWTQSLVLPPGSYVLMATVHIGNLGSDPGEAWCGISASPSPRPLSDVETAQIPGATIMPNNATNLHPTSIAFNLAVTLTNAVSQAHIGCFNNSDPSTSDLVLLNFHFSAIRVGTLTYQP
jgi:hypothetical protein